MGEFVDYSDVTDLVADLRSVPFDTGENIVKAHEVSAVKIRDSWREKLSGSETVPQGAQSVTYDMGANESLLRDVLTGRPGRASEVYTEIGPELDRPQGPIVGMLEYGTPNTAPRGFGAEALRENEDDFARGIDLAVEAAHRRRNL